MRIGGWLVQRYCPHRQADLSVFGDIPFRVDGEPVDFTRRVTWRGLMISGVPNMAYSFGYFRHSWTLRVDLNNDVVSTGIARTSRCPPALTLHTAYGLSTPPHATMSVASANP